MNHECPGCGKTFAYNYLLLRHAKSKNICSTAKLSRQELLEHINDGKYMIYNETTKGLTTTLNKQAVSTLQSMEKCVRRIDKQKNFDVQTLVEKLQESILAQVMN